MNIWLYRLLATVFWTTFNDISISKNQYRWFLGILWWLNENYKPINPCISLEVSYWLLFLRNIEFSLKVSLFLMISSSMNFKKKSVCETKYSNMVSRNQDFMGKMGTSVWTFFFPLLIQFWFTASCGRKYYIF